MKRIDVETLKRFFDDVHRCVHTGPGGRCMCRFHSLHIDPSEEVNNIIPFARLVEDEVIRLVKEADEEEQQIIIALELDKEGAFLDKAYYNHCESSDADSVTGFCETWLERDDALKYGAVCINHGREGERARCIEIAVDTLVQWRRALFGQDVLPGIMRGIKLALERNIKNPGWTPSSKLPDGALVSCPKPWCRGEAKIHASKTVIGPDSGRVSYFASCMVCGCRGPYRDTEAEAAVVWNGEEQ